MTFTTQNIEDLRSVCQRMDKLLAEHNEGSLMWSQMMFLGNLIKEFLDKEIVAKSGVLSGLELKITKLIALCGAVPYVGYYSHTECDMYKIDNPFTQYATDTIVLHPVSESFEKSVDAALEAIAARKSDFRK